MKRLQKAALIAEMLDRMIDNHSWAGETHLQKCLFFLQNMRQVPTGYLFQLYRYGPFSFDLRDELVHLQGDGLVTLSPRPYPYGPTLKASDSSQQLRTYFPRTLKTYKNDLSFVADRFGGMTAGELEKRATAYYFHLKDRDNPDELIAAKVNEIKPHISIEAATEATRQIRAIAKTATRR